MQIGSIKIPAYEMFQINIDAIHKDARVFKNPHEFIPERFDPLNKEGWYQTQPQPQHHLHGQHPPMSFVPFLGGKRQCMGRDWIIGSANLGT